MKRIAYKKRQSLKHRRKVISIEEYSEDQECATHVHKSFIYIVKRARYAEVADSAPEIFIRKHCDNKRGKEDFSFKVRGEFTMTQERCTFRIAFCHILRIHLNWKSKAFSPKKSVTLT